MNNIILLTVLLPIFISTIFIPYWTRRTESFGITIPEEIYYTDRLKKMRKQFVIFSAVASVILTLLFFIVISINDINDEIFAIYFSSLIGLYLIAHFSIYYYFHRKMKKLKQQEKWGSDKPQQVFIDTEFRRQRLNHSNLWFVIPFLISFATIAVSFKFYDHIPNQFPVQYNFSGEVTNWVTKSPRTVLALPIIQLYLILLFMLLNTMIAKAKQQIHAERPVESMQQNIIFRRRWSIFLIGTGIGTSLLLTLTQFFIVFSINPTVISYISIIFTFILVVWAIILSITTGQGGSRVKIAKGNSGEIINRDDDKHWKLGVIYFNPNDPAIFLEKRFGVGWTINLARPLAWIIFIVLIGTLIAIPYLLGV
ncbi:DUF1648 domain-containing protein [Ornithinibacillus bavariensis]|uniref:Membrane protein n=1 Tax=Ornithinibacillus bavariensis TaxID=545502 RepID=A0A919X8N2_9BACI|nr:DUF5808 domain-containing protein [Ornithinibacillus bavariensis]GIO27859.1 membrane protein [Ornithinibacillus bavariensis]